MCAGSEGKVDDKVSKSDGCAVQCCAFSLVPLKKPEAGNVKNSLSGLSATICGAV